MYNNLSFNTLSNQAQKPPVIVKYAGLDIASIAGPAPMVELSTSFNNNALGVAESFTHNITLVGKIVRKAYDDTVNSTVENPICNNETPLPAGSGIKAVTSGIKALKEHLENCPVGVFTIECANPAGVKLYEASGVKVSSFNIDQGNSQWTQTVDYTINLEYIEAADTTNPPVTEMNDAWSIEPLDDISYEDFSVKLYQKGEWHNPKLKPTEPSVGRQQPAGYVNAGNNTADILNGNINIINIPQFRITRSLAAKGIPVAGTGVSGICFTGSGKSNSNMTKYQHTAFAAAKQWVDKQLTNSFMGNTWKASGILYFSSTDNAQSMFNADKIYLYNHTRTTNIDIYNGRYELNESWVAMPTGLAYSEEYNIEISTSEDYTKTVRVAGTVKGLSLTNIDTMQGSGILQDIVVPTGADEAKFDGKISLTGSLKKPETATLTAYMVPDANPKANSDFTMLQSSKYQNAYSGWIYNIKPYIYRRASIGINSPDRNFVANRGSIKPLNNPIYEHEGLLSPIPRSTSEGHDPKRGTITYSYEYSNSSMLISGVVSENVSISNDAPTDVISETQIIGRELGPIMTRSGKTSPRKSVSVEIIVPKPRRPAEMWQSNPQCPLWTGGYIWNTVDSIIEGVKPFGLAEAKDNYLWGVNYVPNAGSQLNPKNRNSLRPGLVYVSSDQESWNPTTGRYSRSVSWVYQQCDNKIRYLDH